MTARLRPDWSQRGSRRAKNCARAYRMRENGVSWTKIAAAVGASQAAIGQMIRQHEATLERNASSETINRGRG